MSVATSPGAFGRRVGSAPSGSRSLRRDARSPVDLRRSYAGHELLLELRDPAGAAPWAARFRAIRAASGAIDSPHIARICGLDLREERSVLRLDDPGGPTLSELCGAPLPPRRVLALASDLARAASALHDAGLLARMLSPDSFVLDEADRAVLVDLAFVTPFDGAHRTEPGEMEDNAAYRAPEQLGGSDVVVGPGADLYAIGAILYHLLAGRPPFVATSRLELVRQHTALPPPPLQHAVSKDFAGLVRVVLRLLEKDPARRYRSAKTLLDDLARCERMLERDGVLSAFPLGSASPGVFFHSSRGPLGRPAERARMLEAVDAAAAGSSRVLAIVGPAGIGKSTLLGLAAEGVAARGGLLGVGAVAPLLGVSALAPLPAALDQLAVQLLAGDGRRLVDVRAALRDTSPATAELLRALCPRLEHLLPPAAASSTGDSAASRSGRRGDALHRLLVILAELAAPVVLVLDDLQRATEETLGVLRGLLFDRPVPGVVALLGWRSGSGEVDAWWWGELDSENRERIDLGPLTRQELDELISDTLVLPVDKPEALGEVVLRRSAGNPFDVGTFLTEAVRSGGLSLDEATLGWTLHPARLNRLDATAAAADGVAEGLSRLPLSHRQALQAGACLGAIFEASRVATLLGWSEDEAQRTLESASEAGVVGPLSLQPDSPDTGAFRFLHDRLQEACLNAVPEHPPALLHHRIAQRLLDELAPGSPPNQLIEAARQLKLGGCPDPASAPEHARWNLRAARAARTAASWASVRSFAERGIELLAEDPWRDHELGLALRMESIRAAAGLSDRELIELRSGEVFAQARDPLEAVDAWEAVIEDLIARNRSADALDVFRRAAASVGYRLPRAVGKAQVVRALLRAHLALRGWTDASLDALPPVTDPQAEAVQRLMFRTTTAAYAVAPETFALLACELVRLGVEAGASVGTAWGLSNFAVLRSAVLGKHEDACRLGPAGLRMFERFEPHPFGAQACSFWNITLLPTKSPLSATLGPLKAGFEQGLADGQLLHAGINACFFVVQLALVGEPLERVAAEGHAILADLRSRDQELTAHTASVFVQWAEALRHPEADPLLSGEAFDSHRVLPELAASGDGPLVVFYAHAARTILATILGDDEAALAHAALAAPRAAAGLGTVPETQFWFYRGIALGRAALRARGAERRGGRRDLLRTLRKLRRRAALCPEDWEHKIAMLDGLAALLAGRADRAVGCFERAVAGARHAGAVHEEALAFELSAKALEGLGAHRAALEAMRAALARYGAWGAHAKVARLQREASAAPHPARGSERRLRGRRADLDAEALLGAQAALSHSADPRVIQTTLLHRAVQQAGASRGVLLVARDGGLAVVARTEAGEEVGCDPIPLAEFEPICRTAVQLVTRTGEPVLEANASRSGHRWTDPWVTTGSVESLLCLPVGQAGRISGALYLEHGSLVGAFGQEHLPALRLLASLATAQTEAVERVRSLEGRTAELARARDEAVALRDEFADRVEDQDQALANAQELQGLVLDALSEGVIGLDADGLVVLANPAAHALLRAHGPALLGRSFHRSFHCSSGEGLCPVCEGSRATTGVEGQLRRADGTSLPVECAVRPLDVALPGGVARVVSFHDIGRRSALEAQLLRTRKQEAVGQFVAGVAHEFNNLLTPLLGHLSWLGNDVEKGSPQALAFDDMERSSRRAAALVQQLLAFGQQSSVFLTHVNAGSTVQEVVSLIARSLPSSVSIECSTEPEDLWFRGDPRQLEQVVSNLCTNARDALEGGPEGGRIRVSVSSRTVSPEEAENTADGSRPGDWVEILVADNGQGIDPATRERLFDPFFTTKAIGRGSGLGLAVVLGVVRQHGGWIAVDDAPGGGGEFRVFLRRVSPPAALEAAKPAEPARQPSAPRVLIIDDEAVVRRLASIVLEREGYIIEQAPDGKAGLQALRDAEPGFDLVLLDLSMPGMDGWETLDAIRAERLDVPVMLISGFNLSEEERMELGGAQGFLPKPFYGRQLIEAVESILPEVEAG